MIQLGITGGIGSGKTTICKLLEYFGIPVFYADDEAKKILMQYDVISKIKKKFGVKLLKEDGELDRKKLSDLVFSEPKKLTELNAIIHPEVAKKYNEWLIKNKRKAIVAKEAAILFESKSNVGLDKIVTIFAPKELRIKRVMKRSNLKKSEVISRMKNQLPEKEKIRKSDFVIHNDEKKNVVPQLLNILKKLNYNSVSFQSNSSID